MPKTLMRLKAVLAGDIPTTPNWHGDLRWHQLQCLAPISTVCRQPPVEYQRYVLLLSVLFVLPSFTSETMPQIHLEDKRRREDTVQHSLLANFNRCYCSLIMNGPLSSLTLWMCYVCILSVGLQASSVNGFCFLSTPEIPQQYFSKHRFATVLLFPLRRSGIA